MIKCIKQVEIDYQLYEFVQIIDEASVCFLHLIKANSNLHVSVILR